MFKFSFLSCCEHLREEQLSLWLDMEETRSFNQLSCPSPPFLPPCSLPINWQMDWAALCLQHTKKAIVNVHNAPPLTCKWTVADGLLRRYEGGCTKDARWARLPSAGISWKWGAENQWMTCAVAGMRVVLAVRVCCAAHNNRSAPNFTSLTWHLPGKRCVH